MDNCCVCGADRTLCRSGFSICLVCSEDGHEPNPADVELQLPFRQKPSPEIATASISVDALIQLHSLDVK
jgi:hypothetical protein